MIRCTNKTSSETVNGWRLVNFNTILKRVSRDDWFLTDPNPLDVLWKFNANFNMTEYKSEWRNHVNTSITNKTRVDVRSNTPTQLALNLVRVSLTGNDSMEKNRKMQKIFTK